MAPVGLLQAEPGTAIRESAELIKTVKANFKGALIALDRMERGQGTLSAIQEAREELGIEIASIITFNDLIAYVKEEESLSSHVDAMLEYREEYGV